MIEAATIEEDDISAVPPHENEDWRETLESFPPAVIRQAWFTMAHLVLEDGSTVADMGTRDGALTYAMAVMHPQHHFIGMDTSAKKVRDAQKKYARPNLEYHHWKNTEPCLKPASVEAVLNGFTLHEIYSAGRCSEAKVLEALEGQFSCLKQNGLLFIRDFVLPEQDYVLLEMPDENAVPDLLIQYSEKAGHPDDPAQSGFYLEELPPRFPRTRLFRLPGKWAYEFILRKDDLENWEEELGKEYSFFTEKDFRRALTGMGSRVLYTAPHWDEQIVKSRFRKKFKLFNEAGSPLGAPPTSFVLVAQKKKNRESLRLQERKHLRGQEGSLQITAMRDDTNGRIHDIVSRGIENTEVLPYRITQDGRLHVYVHEGLPRGIVNAVPRNAPNLDGKTWSGHMIEALCVPQEKIHEIKPGDIKSLVRFSQTHVGLKPVLGAEMEDGPGFYPAPDSIDERIETKYLAVQKPQGNIKLPAVTPDIEGFSTHGHLREIDGQAILNAVGVGLVPSSRLEVQVLALYEKLNIPYEPWADCPLLLETGEVEKTTKLQDIISKLAASDDRFKETKAVAGQFRTIHSVFVDEGQVDGAAEGLASRNMEFAVPEHKSMNMAVVLPLVKKLSGEVMAGITEQFLPVPQRYKGTGYTVSCPAIALPKDITTLEMARKYIADQFEVPVDCVSRMGESFFCHAGITPQRIYPFAVTKAGTKGWRKVGRTHGVTTYTPLPDLHKLLYLDNYYSFMKVAAMAYKGGIGAHSDLSPSYGFSSSQAAEISRPVGVSGTDVSSSLPASPPASSSPLRSFSSGRPEPSTS